MIYDAKKNNNPSIHVNSDLLANLINDRIADNIEAFYAALKRRELEAVKFLHHFHCKFDGNVQIPVKNLMKRFNVSRRWIHKILKRLNDLGIIYTVKRGYWGNVTKRTFTARGEILMKAIKKGFGAVKKLIPRNSAHYSAHYEPPDTIYKSSEVDIKRENPISDNKLERRPDGDWVRNLMAMNQKLLADPPNP